MQVLPYVAIAFARSKSIVRMSTISVVHVQHLTLLECCGKPPNYTRASPVHAQIVFTLSALHSMSMMCHRSDPSVTNRLQMQPITEADAIVLQCWS